MFMALVVALLVALAVIKIYDRSENSSQKYLKIGSGSKEGVYYKVGEGIAKLVNKDKKSLRKVSSQVYTSEGSVYNINALMKGSFDVAFVQADVKYFAYNGYSHWTGSPQKKLRAICSLYPEMVTLVAAQESYIKNFSNIMGKIVNIGSYGSGTRSNVLDCLMVYGLMENRDFVSENFKVKDALAMLNSGRIDAFFYTVGHPNDIVKAATKGERKVSIVPLKGMGELVRKFPFYKKTTIPANMYPDAENGNKDVETIGVTTSLVATEDLDEGVVYSFTKALFENIEEIKKLHPSLAEISLEEMARESFVPIHPGALRYYREIGLEKK